MDIGDLVQAVEALDGSDRLSLRLTAAEWQTLAPALQRRSLQAGELLLRQGDVGDQAFFLQRGRLLVFVTQGHTRSHRVAQLPAGTLVGESGLFGTLPRMAHVEALEPALVWALEAEALQRLAPQAPRLVLEVLRAAGALMARRTHANLDRGIPQG
jgi:CRP-like cAMP-binding protein